MAKTAVNEVFLSPDGSSNGFTTSSPWVVPIGKRFVGKLIFINYAIAHALLEATTGQQLVEVKTAMPNGIGFILISTTVSNGAATFFKKLENLESSVFILKPGSSVKPFIAMSQYIGFASYPGPTFMLMGFLEDDI